MGRGGIITGRFESSSYCTSDARWMLGLGICFYTSPHSTTRTMNVNCSLIFLISSVSSTALSHIINTCISSAEVPVRTLNRNTCYSSTLPRTATSFSWICASAFTSAGDTVRSSSSWWVLRERAQRQQDMS